MKALLVAIGIIVLLGLGCNPPRREIIEATVISQNSPFVTVVLADNSTRILRSGHNLFGAGWKWGVGNTYIFDLYDDRIDQGTLVRVGAR